MDDLGFAAQLADDLSVEDLKLVLSVFDNDVRRLTGTLGAAAAAGDNAGFRRAAHALAGAAGAVGAIGLERACRLAMTGDGATDAILAEVRTVAESALADVAQVLARLDARP